MNKLKNLFKVTNDHPPVRLVYDYMEKYVKETWDKLNKEFETDIKLYIHSELVDFEVFITELPSITGSDVILSATTALNKYKNMHVPDNLMETRITSILKDSTVSQRVVFITDNLYRIIGAVPYTYKGFKILEQYLGLCLRHEIGHCISNSSIIKNYGINDGVDIIINNANEFIKKYKELDDGDYGEYIRNYHEIPQEKLANEAGKVNIDDFVKIEVFMMDYLTTINEKYNGDNS